MEGSAYLVEWPWLIAAAVIGIWAAAALAAKTAEKVKAKKSVRNRNFTNRHYVPYMNALINGNKREAERLLNALKLAAKNERIDLNRHYRLEGPRKPLSAHERERRASKLSPSTEKERDEINEVIGACIKAIELNV